MTDPIDIAELRRRVNLKRESTRSNIALPPEMTIAPLTVSEASALLDEVERLLAVDEAVSPLRGEAPHA